MRPEDRPDHVELRENQNRFHGKPAGGDDQQRAWNANPEWLDPGRLMSILQQISRAARLMLFLAPLVGAMAQVPGFRSTTQLGASDVGSDFRLQAAFEGRGPIQFRWRRDGQEVAQMNEETGPAGIVSTLRFTALADADTGTYVVEAITPEGTFQSRPIAVVVRPAQAPVFVSQSGNLTGPNATALSVFITGSPPYTYRWFRNGIEIQSESRTTGSTDGGLSLGGLPGGPAGEYFLEVSNHAGRIVSRTMRVTSGNPSGAPYFQEHPRNLGLRLGQINTLVARLSEQSATSTRFQWRRNGIDIPGATNFVLTVGPFVPALAGRYSLLAVTASGQTLVSDEGEVTLVGPATAAPVFLLQPLSRTVPPGSCVTLAAEAEGAADGMYQWYKDGIPVSGATSRTLFLVDVSAADAARYRVDAGPPGGPVTAGTEALLTVSGPSASFAPLLLQPPAARSVTFAAGTPASLSVVVAGSPAPSVVWLRNGTLVPDGNGPTLSIPSPSALDAGLYHAIVTNPLGSIRTESVTVAVTGNIPAKPILAPVARNKISATPGDTVDLVFEGSSSTAAQVVWLWNGVPISTVPVFPNAESRFSVSHRIGRQTTTASGTISGIRASDAGNYGIVATNSQGSTNSEVVAVSIRPPHLPGVYFRDQAPNSGAIYIGTDGKLAALMVNISGLDYRHSVSDVAVRPDGTFEYSVLRRNLFPPQPIRGAGFVRTDSIQYAQDNATDSLFPLSGAQGEFAAYVGYWKAPLDPPRSGSVEAIINARGQVLLMYTWAQGSANAVEHQIGSLGSDGAFRISFIVPAEAAPKIRFNPAAGTFGGTALGPLGNMLSFSGRRLAGPLANRFANIATRGFARSGDDTLIAGFVIAGGSAQTVLIRAAGPALAALGVRGAHPDSRLELFRESARIAENDDWAVPAGIAQAAARVGAFAFPPGSRDAALVQTLSPGAYSAQVKAGNSAPQAEGVVLLEIYDAGGGGSPRLANISTRGWVGIGENLLVAGIVIAGEMRKTVLIRAIGPSLARFGVAGALADPILRLYSGGTLIYENDNWFTNTFAADAAARVGAFPLTVPAKDSALVVTLPPGSYTAQISGLNGSTGVALAEIYEVGDQR